MQRRDADSLMTSLLGVLFTLIAVISMAAIVLLKSKADTTQSTTEVAVTGNATPSVDTLQVLDGVTNDDVTLANTGFTPNEALVKDLLIKGSLTDLNGCNDLKDVSIDAYMNSPVDGSGYSVSYASSSTAISDSRAFIAGNYMYTVGYMENQLDIYDISDPSDVHLVSAFTTIMRPSKVFVQGTKAYILGDWSWDLQIVDISDPANPAQVGHWNGGESLDDIQVRGNYAYISSRHGGYLITLDVSNPSSVVQTAYMILGHAAGGLVLDQTGSFLYVSTTEENRLTVYSLATPAEPLARGYVSIGVTPYQVLIKGSTVFVTSGSSVKVVDVSDPDAPSVTDTLATNGDLSTYQSAAIVGGVLYTSGANWSINLWDIGAPANIVSMGNFSIGQDNSFKSIAGNSFAIFVTYQDGFKAFPLPRGGDPGCTAEGNDCYHATAQIADCSNGNSATFQVVIPVVNYANPTDSGSPNENAVWMVKATVTDKVDAPASLTKDFEMNSLAAFATDGSIDYGSVALGQMSGEKTVDFTSTGNRNVDALVVALHNDPQPNPPVDGDMHSSLTGFDIIPAGATRYSLATGFGALEGDAVSKTSAQTFAIHLPQQTDDQGAAPQVPTYWHLNMPDHGVNGTYQNTLVFTAQAY